MGIVVSLVRVLVVWVGIVFVMFWCFLIVWWIVLVDEIVLVNC